jgi:hypothetical protein
MCGTRRRSEKTDQHFDGCRLAGSVCAEEAEDFSGLDIEGDAIDCREIPESARQVLYCDRRLVRPGLCH